MCRPTCFHLNNYRRCLFAKISCLATGFSLMHAIQLNWWIASFSRVVYTYDIENNSFSLSLTDCSWFFTCFVSLSLSPLSLRPSLLLSVHALLSASWLTPCCQIYLSSSHTTPGIYSRRRCTLDVYSLLLLALLFLTRKSATRSWAPPFYKSTLEIAPAHTIVLRVWCMYTFIYVCMCVRMCACVCLCRGSSREIEGEQENTCVRASVY